MLHRGKAGGKIFDLYTLRGNPISPEQSVQGQLKVISGLTAADNGSFKDYNGNDIPF